MMGSEAPVQHGEAGGAAEPRLPAISQEHLLASQQYAAALLPRLVSANS